MLPLFKLLLFFLVLAVTGLSGFLVYKKLNEKIIASETVTTFFIFSLILIAANAMLLFGGILVLIKVFDFLNIVPL